MTIRDMQSDSAVTGVLQSGERARTHRLLCAKLTPQEVGSVRDALDVRIQGSRIETARWIPGSDWSGTPYKAIHEKGARKNPELAAPMFGLMVGEAFERHEEDWCTNRFSMGGEEDRFRIYFRRDA